MVKYRGMKNCLWFVVKLWIDLRLRCVLKIQSGSLQNLSSIFRLQNRSNHDSTACSRSQTIKVENNKWLMRKMQLLSDCLKFRKRAASASILVNFFAYQSSLFDVPYCKMKLLPSKQFVFSHAVFPSRCLAIAKRAMNQTRLSNVSDCKRTSQYAA